MANPTTNFGWVMPTSADLVTDLPADFNVFGQGVDTSMQYLLGGTTGQILSKTSATNMAFTWIANDTGDITGVTAGTGISGGGTSGTVTVTNSMATAITTNGDIIYGTGSGTFSRLGIGSSAQVLTVASGVPSWATPTASSNGLTFINKQTFTASSAVNIDNVFSATYTYYKIVWSLTAAGGQELQFRLRVSSTDTTTGYNISQIRTTGASTSTATQETNITYIPASFGTVSGIKTGEMVVFDPFSAVSTKMNYTHYSEDASAGVCGSRQTGATSFTGCTFLCNATTITGEILIYGFNRS